MSAKSTVSFEKQFRWDGKYEVFLVNFLERHVHFVGINDLNCKQIVIFNVDGRKLTLFRA